MPSNDFDADQPYCGNCGQQLTGLVDASRCPECGRPLVEVLMRGGRWGRRYRSKATLFGLPVIDVAYGPKPGEKIGRPRGIIALGDAPVGFLAIGGMARGFVALGGVAFGVISCGGVSISLLAALGGVAIGALASGGVAIGLFASGGLVLGFIGTGGIVVGVYAIGGAPFGLHTAGGSGANSQEAMGMFRRFSWFFGPGTGAGIMLQPILVIGAIIAAGAALVGLLGVLGTMRHGSGSGEEPFAP